MNKSDQSEGARLDEPGGKSVFLKYEALVLYIFGILVTGICFYYEFSRMDSIKNDRQHAFELMASFHGDLVTNFADVSKAVFRITEPHQMKILDETTCEQAIPCATYLSTIEKLQQELEENGILGNSIKDENLGFSYLAARVLIYAGKAKKDYGELESRINQYLEQHQEIAEEKEKQYLRYSHNLKGLFLAERAQLLGAISTQPKLEMWDAAISSYEKALNSSYEYNDTNYVWDPPLSAILSIREDQYVSTNIQHYLSDLIDRVKREAQHLKSPTPVLDDIGPVLSLANLAEAYIIEEDFSAAQDVLDDTRIWSRDNLDTLMSMSLQDDPRKLLNTIVSLWIYTEACRYLVTYPEGINDQLIHRLQKRSDEHDLTAFPYSQDLIEVTFDLLKIHQLCNQGNVKYAKALYLVLEEDIRTKLPAWKQPGGYSRPKIILILLANNILGGRFAPNY